VLANFLRVIPVDETRWSPRRELVHRPHIRIVSDGRTAGSDRPSADASRPATVAEGFSVTASLREFITCLGQFDPGA
jgi:hypothetical protein